MTWRGKKAEECGAMDSRLSTSAAPGSEPPGSEVPAWRSRRPQYPFLFRSILSSAYVPVFGSGCRVQAAEGAAQRPTGLDATHRSKNDRTSRREDHHRHSLLSHPIPTPFPLAHTRSYNAQRLVRAKRTKPLFPRLFFSSGLPSRVAGHLNPSSRRAFILRPMTSRKSPSSGRLPQGS